jgi:heat shock protein HslJ
MRLMGVLMAGLCLAACGNEVRAGGGDAQAGGGGSPVGTSYLSIKLTEDGKVKELVPDTRIRLDFRDDGALAFHTGCNQLGGMISLDGGIITMDVYGGTEIGCSPARLAQDVWIGQLLKERPTWKLEGDVLTLTRGSTTLVLQDRKIVQPDLPIAGTTWTVDGVMVGEASSTTTNCRRRTSPSRVSESPVRPAATSSSAPSPRPLGAWPSAR